MIRTHHMIESNNIEDILYILAGSVNITLATSIQIELTNNPLSFVHVEWELPKYSEKVDEAISEYIYYAVAEGNAKFNVDRHRESAILDMWQEWHLRALDRKLSALEDLQTTCLGN